MQWIEASFRTHSQDIDALCEKLTELGADGLVIEDEADFRRFLAENRQYWDYVDEDLESRYSGVSRVKVYVADDTGGRARLARWTEALGIEPVGGAPSVLAKQVADDEKRFGRLVKELDIKAE